MISIIICSVNEQFARQVKRNIAETIGVPYELVLIDNAVLKKGITHVYNLGASRAIYNTLCFVHEDVLFNTPDWGKEIISLFETDPGLGIIGVAGSKYKARTFSGWATNIEAYDCCNILHLSSSGEQKKIYLNPNPAKTFQPVVVTDGVFMCTPKKVWQQLPFDENLITGFHLYDIDFSFRISRQYRAGVTFNIDITHLTSGGSYGNNWVEYTFAWHQHFQHQLPGVLTDEPKIPHAESIIRRGWLNRLKSEPISWRNKFNWLFKSGTLTDPRAWTAAGIFVIFRLVKKEQRLH